MSQAHAAILSDYPAIANHKGDVSPACSLSAWPGKLLDPVEETSEGASSQKKERLCALHQEEENNQEPESKEMSYGPSCLQDSFHSNFSFIQLSLNSASEARGIAGASGGRELKETVQLCGVEKTESINVHVPGEGLRTSRTELWASYNSRCDEVCTCPWEAAEDDSLQDSRRLSPFHANNAFFCSMDSLEATSADSSVTSGYESCGIASDHSWDFLMKEYEPVLQECLMGNQRLIKIKSLMRKLQKLQEKAVAEDDYEKADKFRRRLEELHKQKCLLNFQLPSRHPLVSRFLDKFRAHVQMMLYERIHKERKLLEKSDQKILSLPYHEKIQVPVTKRDQLVEEKKWIQKEIEVLRAKLVVLEAKDQQLRIEIQEQDRLIQDQDYELSALLSWVSLKELQTIGKALADILAASHKIPCRLDFSESVKRLQEKEQSLNMSMTDTAAKVCTSQKLCSTLRKKMRHIEIQLPALLETKMLAASGGNFCTAKDVAEEIQSLMAERDCLERLLNEWSTLHAKNIQKLEKVKEGYKRLKEEMEQEEFAFEKKLKENTLKYMEVLEEKLQSCGRSHLLEKICEVDLEACQLLIHGFLLNKNGSSVSEGEESQTEEMEGMEDASLTLKWEQSKCFSVNSSKHRAFRHPPIGSKQQSACCELKEEFDMLSTDLREKCETISKKLMFLEDQLQLAFFSYDEDLVQSLQREIQMVKETLQAMLVQLQPTKEAGEDAAANFLGDSWCRGKQSLKE